MSALKLFSIRNADLEYVKKRTNSSENIECSDAKCKYNMKMSLKLSRIICHETKKVFVFYFKYSKKAAFY